MLVILGQAAMAIFHHYVLRDDVLSKISPLRERPFGKHKRRPLFEAAFAFFQKGGGVRP